ncbi:MAG: Ti-type conjugative transfer relaxase TraA [Nevskia sp.]|nr:Ti-type conjugative transfer relaxase TraA [Nevskia sp.]
MQRKPDEFNEEGRTYDLLRKSVLVTPQGMAIYHLSQKPVTRATGRSAVAAAAYRSGVRLTNERDGQTHDYRARQGVVHTEIVLPEAAVGCDWARERNALWNAAEAAENRKDARTATEIVVALPHELTDEQRLKLTREFATHLADRYGVAVDFAIHKPDDARDLRNVHAHLLMTTRQVTPEGLGEKTELQWSNKRLLSENLPTAQMQLGMLRLDWEHQANRALAQAGIEARIDRRSHAERGLEIEPTQHAGVAATEMRRRGVLSERERISAAAAARNAQRVQARPAEVLSILTGEKSVFDRQDIARTLHRYIDQPEAFQAAFAKVMASPALMELQPEQRDARGQVVALARYTTRAQFTLERDMAARAERMVATKDSSLAGSLQKGVTERRLAQNTRLSDEQRAAVRHLCGREHIAAVVGLAGAGKSTMLSVAREAWEGRGRRVLGAALAGKAAEGLEQSAGIASRTLASWERSWEHGKDVLKAGDVLVIDEAGMVSSEQLARFVAAADTAGAKLVLVGDPEQLQPINAGAAFRAIAERVGCVEMEGIRRQGEAWMREASVAFGRNRTGEGLAAYAAHDAIRFVDDAAQARAAIVRDVVRDMAERQAGNRIVLAHRRADVQALNEAIRAARQAQGELVNEAGFVTKDGERQFAVGDRLVFLENDRTLGVKNGMLGTVEHAEVGGLRVRLDPSEGRGPGRVVAVDETYGAVDHGYATTIHKSQGATVDRAFVLASESMDRHLAYVSMTRHREAVTLHAGRDEFADLAALSARLSRSNAKETTLDYAERRGLAPKSEIVVPLEQVVPAPAEHVRAPAPQSQQPDSLRAKVQAAMKSAEERREAATRPPPAAETHRDALRRELRGLSPDALWAATKMPQVTYDGFRTRDLTVDDAARQLSPAYAAAAAQAETLRKEVAAAEASVQHYVQAFDYHQAEGDARWRAMGTWRQYGHRSGLRLDPQMSLHESMEKSMTREWTEAERKREALAKALPAAEHAEVSAFGAVRPKAEQLAAAARERVEVAQEVHAELSAQRVLAARQERDRPRTRAERLAEREQEKSHEQDLGR